MKIFRRNDEEAVSPVIAIILMVAITVVLASVLYVWVMNLADTGEEAAKFPTIEVTLKEGVPLSPTPSLRVDSLTIKHTAGDPLDWTKFKIIITNQSDDTDTSVMNSLSGEITAGESLQFNGSNSAGFASIEFQKTKSYQIEIYNIKENKQVWIKKNVICE
jgi:flagellin-like protein